jgi:hypothetical protein
MWCAVYFHGTIGPHFSENEEGRSVNMKAEQYTIMPETFLRIELHPRQQDLLWFQQDGATAHTAQSFMQVLRTMIPCGAISRFGDITWPARSPNHAAAD